MSDSSPYPFVKPQFFDDDGEPLSGGLLNAYAVGSSTRQDTFSDASLSTANSNPIVLDTAGRATIFLSPIAYKFVLTTSAGTLVWSQDNVLPWGSALGSSRNLACGRITGVSGSAIADVTGASTIYYTPYKGNQIGLYDGIAADSGSWSAVTFSELSLSLGSDTINTNYDLFMINFSGTPSLHRQAWSNDTARSLNLGLQDGVWAIDIDRRYRYLGTYRTTVAPGVTADSPAFRLIWNYNNRVPRPVSILESTDSWTYTTAVVRQANGSAANQIGVVVGLAEATLDLRLLVTVSNSLGTILAVGIGQDSVTTQTSGGTLTVLQTGPFLLGSVAANLVLVPTIGYHYYAWLEFSTASGVTTWYGDNGGTYALQSGMLGTWEA